MTDKIFTLEQVLAASKLLDKKNPDPVWNAKVTATLIERLLNEGRLNLAEPTHGQENEMHYQKRESNGDTVKDRLSTADDTDLKKGNMNPQDTMNIIDPESLTLHVGAVGIEALKNDGNAAVYEIIPDYHKERYGYKNRIGEPERRIKPDNIRSR